MTAMFSEMRIVATLVVLFAIGVYLLYKTKAIMNKNSAKQTHRGRKWLAKYELSMANYLTLKLIGLVLVAGPGCVLCVILSRALSGAR